ncbi:MAG: hypothetical protein A2Y76_04180 [Planctomycetes bacterium RBG_13_60_9]|nr:MAG: hypothetical protein A2Y76_04180 [Planctomycetes bacterium RBG_13_60_9]
MRGRTQGELTITLKEGVAEYPDEIDSIQLLDSGAKIDWTRTTEGVIIKGPSAKPCDFAVVFKITPKKRPAS